MPSGAFWVECNFFMGECYCCPGLNMILESGVQVGGCDCECMGLTQFYLIGESLDLDRGARFSEYEYLKVLAIYGIGVYKDFQPECVNAVLGWGS